MHWPSGNDPGRSPPELGSASPLPTHPRSIPTRILARCPRKYVARAMLPLLELVVAELGQKGAPEEQRLFQRGHVDLDVVKRAGSGHESQPFGMGRSKRRDAARSGSMERMGRVFMPGASSAGGRPGRGFPELNAVALRVDDPAELPKLRFLGLRIHVAPLDPKLSQDRMQVFNPVVHHER